MNISKEQLQLEIKYLEETFEIIESLIEEDNKDIKNKINSISEMKSFIWENHALLDDGEIASGMYDVNNDVSYTNDNIKKMLKI